MSAARSRRVVLSSAERFDLWGARVVQLTLPRGEQLTWSTFVTLRSSRGFVGSVTPGSSPEVANALTSRGLL